MQRTYSQTTPWIRVRIKSVPSVGDRWPRVTDHIPYGIGVPRPYHCDVTIIRILERVTRVYSDK